MINTISLVWEWSGTQEALLTGFLGILVESVLTSDLCACYSCFPKYPHLSRKLCLTYRAGGEEGSSFPEGHQTLGPSITHAFLQTLIVRLAFYCLW